MQPFHYRRRGKKLEKKEQASGRRDRNSSLKLVVARRILPGMKWFLLLGLTVILAAGCAKKDAPAAAPEISGPFIPTHAQGKLPGLRLWLGPAEIEAELAVTEEQVMTGMMFRTNLDENGGMLFVFPRASQVSFWMKNCTVPLSAAYIDPAGAIVEIHDLEPRNTNSVVAKGPNVQFVLEVSQGWFKRHQVEPGAFVRTERGTLQETFFRRPQGQ
jgi:hypothetical protein